MNSKNEGFLPALAVRSCVHLEDGSLRNNAAVAHLHHTARALGMGMALDVRQRGASVVLEAIPLPVVPQNIHEGRQLGKHRGLPSADLGRDKVNTALIILKLRNTKSVKFEIYRAAAFLPQRLLQLIWQNHPSRLKAILTAKP